MIHATIGTSDFDRASRLMAAAPKVFVEQMRLANMESSKALVERIKAGKLRGQVLNRISGTLLRSWAAKVPPEAISEGWLGGAGSNLDYAAYHEFGSKKDVGVKSFWRRPSRKRLASAFGAKGKDIFSKRKKGPGVVWGDTVSQETIFVSAHRRQLNYDGKPYARPALEEIRDKVKAIHRDRIAKAEEKAKGTT